MPTPSDSPAVVEPQANDDSNPNSQGAKPNDQGAKPTAKVSRETYSEQDLDGLPDWARSEIKHLKGEARERRLKAKEQDDAAKQQREDALVEQQKFQQLADERATEIGKLKPKADQFDELSVLFETQYTAEVKDWPKELLEMAPANDAPITQRLAWLEKAKPMARKLMTPAPSDNGQGQRQPVGGNRRGPEPVTQSLRNQQPANMNDDGPLVDARRKF